MLFLKIVDFCLIDNQEKCNPVSYCFDTFSRLPLCTCCNTFVKSLINMVYFNKIILINDPSDFLVILHVNRNFAHEKILNKFDVVHPVRWKGIYMRKNKEIGKQIENSALTKIAQKKNNSVQSDHLDGGI